VNREDNIDNVVANLRARVARLEEALRVIANDWTANLANHDCGSAARARAVLEDTP